MAWCRKVAFGVLDDLDAAVSTALRDVRAWHSYLPFPAEALVWEAKSDTYACEKEAEDLRVEPPKMVIVAAICSG